MRHANSSEIMNNSSNPGKLGTPPPPHPFFLTKFLKVERVNSNNLDPHFFQSPNDIPKLNCPISDRNAYIIRATENSAEVQENASFFQKYISNAIFERRSPKNIENGSSNNSPSNFSGVSGDEKSELKEKTNKSNKSMTSFKKPNRKSFSICLTNSPDKTSSPNRSIDKGTFLKGFEVLDKLKKTVNPQILLSPAPRRIK